MTRETFITSLLAALGLFGLLGGFGLFGAGADTELETLPTPLSSEETTLSATLPAPLSTLPLTRIQTIGHAHGLAVDIADSSILYIATHNGLLALVDEKDLYHIGKIRNDYMGFSVHPSLPATFYVSGHPAKGGSLGVQQSVDNGVTWQKISGGANGPVDFHSLTISPKDPLTMYGFFRGVQQSRDGGASWSIMNAEHAFMSLVADPLDAQTLYGATPDGKGILVSRDGGATWHSHSPQLAGGMVSTLAVDPLDTEHWLTFAERTRGLAQSQDGGISWTSVAEDFGAETVLHIAYDKNQSDVVYLLTHTNTLWKSTDGGLQWSQISKTLSYNPHSGGISQISAAPIFPKFHRSVPYTPHFGENRLAQNLKNSIRRWVI